MKGYFLGALLIWFASVSFAQTAPPQGSTVTVKKVVKVGVKWYVETNTTTKSFSEITTQMLLGVENDTEEAARDSAEVARAEVLKKEKHAERVERNRLLKDALKKGYVPEIRTLEEKNKVDALKSRVLKP